MADLASLAIKIDATDAGRATTALEGLTAAGGKAEAATASLAKAQKTLAAEAKNVATTYENFFNGDFVSQYAQQASAIGKTTEAYRLNRAQIQELTAVARHSIDQLAAGANPLTVIAQHFSSVAEAAGSGPGGVGGALSALTKFINPVYVGFGLLAAATAGVIAEGLIYAKTLRDMADISAGVGKQAGLTGAAIEDAAVQGARAADVSISSAERQATSLAASGKLTADVIEGVIAVTGRYAQLTGQDAATAAKTLGKDLEDPAQGAAALNAQLGFLNDTQLEQIRVLAESGDKLGASRLLMVGLTEAVKDQAIEAGGLAGLWHNVSTNVSNFAHAAGVAIDGVADHWTKLPPDLKAMLLGNLGTVGAVIGAATAGPGPAAPVRVTRAGIQAGLGPDPNSAVARNQASTLAGEAARALTPGAAGLVTLQTDLAKTNEAMRQLRLTGQATSPVYQQLAADQERYTHAVSTYLDPAAKAHAVAVAEAEVAKAKTPAQKAAAAADLERARAAGEVATATEISTKITDASTIAANRAERAIHAHRDAVADLIAKLGAEIAGNRASAAAYDISSAAGFRASALKTAAVEIAEKHAKGLQAETIRTLELANAVTKFSADQAASIAAENERIAAQSKVNLIMGQAGISQATASKLVKDATELDKLYAAQANATGIDIQVLGDQIQQKAEQQRRANEVDRDALLIAEAHANTNAIQRYQTEVDLIGKSNSERVVRLAQLAEEQRLTALGVSRSDPHFAGAALGAGITASKGLEPTAAQDRYNSALEHTQFLLSELQDSSKDLGQSLTDAFGKPGAAIDRLTSGLVDHAKALDAVAIQRKAVENSTKDPVRLAELDQRAADIRISAYGDTLAAAKSAFGEQTGAYKALQAAEIVFRTIEEVNSLKSIALHATETGAKVAGNAAQASSFGVVAFAHTLASLPFPLNLAAGATVLAALAAIGVSLAGGSGGAATLPGSTDAADRQKAQGTGSVLGDPTAQSKSIEDALNIATANQNKDLQYSSQMVTSLRSIDDNISTLTAAIARDLGVGGSLSTSDLNLGASTQGPGLLQKILNPISALLPGLFGSKTTNTLQDQGLQFGPQSIAQILAGGLQGSSYAEVASETKKKFLGLTYSDKTSLNTTTNPLGADITGDLTRVVASLEQGVLTAASTLGVDGAKATLEALQLNLGTISLKDLTGSALTDAINAVFSKAGDDMAAAVLPGISAFQKAGEGAFETLTRLAHDFETVDVTLESIGKTFGAVGLSSITARENLVALVGGLDNLTQLTSDFAQEFLTPAQQLAPVAAAVSKEMTRLGLTGITTKDAFAKLVLGLDVSTDAGATLYAALLNVAPAFGKVADAAQKAADDAVAAKQSAVQSATQTLTDDYNAQASALQNTISQFQAFHDSLEAFNQTLKTGADAAQDPRAQYNAAKAAFQTTSAQAKAGDPAALGALQTVSQAYLTAAKAAAPDATAYARDLAAVRRAVVSSEDAAQTQVSAAQAQLDALNAQVGALIDIKGHVASIADDVAALLAAQAALNTALTSQSAVETTVPDQTALVQTILAGVNTPPPVVQPVVVMPPVTNDNTPPDLDAILRQTLSGLGGGGGGSRDFGSNLQAFDTGGSGVVGGAGGADSKKLDFALTPGELVNVSKKDDMARVAAALERQNELLAENNRLVAAGAKEGKKTSDILTRVTRDGDKLMAQVA